MSYSAYTGIEFKKDGKWKCLVKSVPDDLKKLHYAFGARSNSVPFVDTDDFDDESHKDISEEIQSMIKDGYYLLGVTSWNKLIEIRERILTEIKEKTHKYKTVKRAFEDMLDSYKENESATKSITEIFKMSTDELRLKGFLDNEYVDDDYSELDYYFFAVQYACNLIQHYCEDYNSEKPFDEYIEPEECRLVMWGC